MIKLLLSLILIILVLVFFWKTVFLNESKKVKFSNNIEEKTYNKNDKEQFTSPEYAQPNNKNNNVDKLRQTYDKINPYNFYTQNYNTPNFVTNVEDVRQFFSYDLPPNSPESTLPIPTDPVVPIEPFENCMTQKEYGNTDQMIEHAKQDTPWLIPQHKKTPSGLEYESDYWVYNNEMPMNGGLFGDIVGYENMGDSFSLFYTKNTSDIVEEQEKALKRNDDLRNGMGTPQKQKYLYNMSNP